MNVHIIQKHILDKLRLTENAKYSELQPNGVESSHFRYHLQRLIAQQLVANSSRGVYSLTDKGANHIDRLSTTGVNEKRMPKVITYSLIRNNTEIVLLRKNKEPYRDLLNMIGGKVHEGETVTDAAEREVHEKTGQHLESKPSVAGVFDVIVRNSDNSILTHATAYVVEFKSQTYLFKENQKIEIVKVSELNTRQDLAPDLLPILFEIESGETIKSIELVLPS